MCNIISELFQTTSLNFPLKCEKAKHNFNYPTSGIFRQKLFAMKLMIFLRGLATLTEEIFSLSKNLIAVKEREKFICVKNQMSNCIKLRLEGNPIRDQKTRRRTLG